MITFNVQRPRPRGFGPLVLRRCPAWIVRALVWLVVGPAAASGQITPLPQALTTSLSMPPSTMPASMPPAMSTSTSPATGVAQAQMMVPPYMAVRNGEECIDADAYLHQQACTPGAATLWDWRLLPDTLIYPAYLAGVKESRFAGIHFFNDGDLFEQGVLGAHVGILRYGTTGDVRPEGWEWDVEGAATPRLNLDDQFDLYAVDFRIGTFLSYGEGRAQYKFGYYHLSSHVGDEFLIKHPSFDRINFRRETLVAGVGYYLWDDIRVYGEVGFAPSTDGGSEPWEFQFGIDYSPHFSTGIRGSLFWALNGYLREEQNFGGDFVAQIGWAWRDRPYGHMLRIGFQYLNGASDEFEFFTQHEQQYGLGIWYDF